MNTTYTKEINNMNYILDKKGFLFLNESLSSARKTYLDTEKVDKETFDKLVKLDPTTSKKYLDKICDFYLQLPSKVDTNVVRLGELFKKYDSLLTRNMIKEEKYKNIKNFKTGKELLDLVLSLENAVSATQYKKMLKNDQAIKILDNEDFFVVVPKTKEASCMFGRGTPWCTAYTNPHKTNMFNQYFHKDKHAIYYILNKKLAMDDIMRMSAVTVFPSGRKVAFDMENDPTKPVPFERVLDMGVPKEIFKTQKQLLSDDDVENQYTDDPKLNALIDHLGGIEDLDAVESRGGGSYEVDGTYYLVLTDDEADESAYDMIWDSIDMYMGLEDMDSHIVNEIEDYLDKEKFARDYIRDSRRGDILGDGSEDEIEFDGVTYYIYEN